MGFANNRADDLKLKYRGYCNIDHLVIKKKKSIMRFIFKVTSPAIN